ncbi:hypothetical protein K435DRAFT_794704 [Dendrothele bispora CBS 962.96]|uniref:Uncharacterized protein n=1 Tax=Dendrothele bispora (strain CBS 962.96) TaxID=1314807 RepID=A0A4S8MCR0_DENBC|nr:hypothetical protein K435DRAFT_794704 [Dendrothele bispora CBS 962.96]
MAQERYFNANTSSLTSKYTDSTRMIMTYDYEKGEQAGIICSKVPKKGPTLISRDPALQSKEVLAAGVNHSIDIFLDTVAVGGGLSGIIVQRALNITTPLPPSCATTGQFLPSTIPSIDMDSFNTENLIHLAELPFHNAEASRKILFMSVLSRVSSSGFQDGRRLKRCSVHAMNLLTYNLPLPYYFYGSEYYNPLLSPEVDEEIPELLA